MYFIFCSSHTIEEASKQFFFCPRCTWPFRVGIRFAYLILQSATNSGHRTDQRGRGAIVKTINILEIYQVLMSATISKCEVCGQEFGTPGELDEHKRAKHQG